MANSKRAFIVFFMGLLDENEFKGHETIMTDGKYMAWQQFVNEMIEDRGYDDVLITNVIEIKPKEYLEWIN